eukprot:5228015-Amphidinium_carterae.1
MLLVWSVLPHENHYLHNVPRFCDPGVIGGGGLSIRAADKRSSFGSQSKHLTGAGCAPCGNNDPSVEAPTSFQTESL